MKAIENWKAELATKRQILEDVKKQSDIFQWDSLSSLLAVPL